MQSTTGGSRVCVVTGRPSALSSRVSAPSCRFSRRLRRGSKDQIRMSGPPAPSSPGHELGQNFLLFKTRDSKPATPLSPRVQPLTSFSLQGPGIWTPGLHLPQTRNSHAPPAPSFLRVEYGTPQFPSPLALSPLNSVVLDPGSPCKPKPCAPSPHPQGPETLSSPVFQI